ncbi:MULTISPECIES: hypothetical protein [unclassified Methylobacterium]|uniref:hypothetical protein n=1 Tax=unclassified Methylobacterium TaxID=2615210 RepID=UPI0011C1FB46|nr:MULTISPECIES: hypothetical protein [unclassified Methylobacterium]QEE38827.1 hypothetical protein FVA80_07475 [Methylobacterium sp. WL1]TXN53617.1 hypothetical protein FV241_27460 [Methylobacterium sp. WL2]
MSPIIRRAVFGASTIPISRAAIDDPDLSMGALGVYCVIAAAGRRVDRGQLLERFGSNPALLDARLNALMRAELIEGGGR